MLDQDLFQMIALGLALISLVVLLLTLQTLQQVKKSLEEGGVSRPSQEQPAAANAFETAAAPAQQAYQAPQQAQVQQSYGLAGGASPYAAEPVVAAQPVAAQAASEPENQPFERDGRWWFRRGNELLVYDEQTAQWVPAPGAATPAVAATTTPAPQQVQQQPVTYGAPAEQQAGSPYVGAGEAAAAPTPAANPTPDPVVAPAAEGAGSFWKCPSCGAINGSTATSCRMCFAARP